jgi:hypothetical protein
MHVVDDHKGWSLADGDAEVTRDAVEQRETSRSRVGSGARPGAGGQVIGRIVET